MVSFVRYNGLMFSFFRRSKSPAPQVYEAPPTHVSGAINELVSSDRRRRVLTLTQDFYGIAPLRKTLAAYRDAGWDVIAHSFPCEGGLGAVGYSEGVYSATWGHGGSDVDAECALEDVGKRVVFLPDFDLLLAQGEEDDVRDVVTILESPNVNAVIAAHTGSRVVPNFDYTQFDTLVMSHADKASLGKRFKSVLDPYLLAKVMETSDGHEGDRLIIASR